LRESVYKKTKGGMAMRKRVIVAAIVVTGLALGVGGYIKAQLSEDLPVFTPGQVLTAQELNDIVEALYDLRNQVNQSEGRLTCKTVGSCNSDQDLSDECLDFVLSCITRADPQVCIGGGEFICEEEELPPDVVEDNVCSIDFCENDQALAGACEEFLDACLQEADTDIDQDDREKCVGAAFLICLEPID